VNAAVDGVVLLRSVDPLFLPLGPFAVREIYIAPQNDEANLRGAGHCTSAKRMTSILKHVAEAFPPAW